MKIINPNEIGVKISTLISESKKDFTAVTPYLDISNWKKILINFEKARNRNVQITLFYREIKDKDYNTLSNLGVKLFKIEGLHTKLYFNESEVIISSMNLYEYSDLHSIDFAMYFNDSENYIEIQKYFEKYILSEIKNLDNLKVEKLPDLHDFLVNKFPEKEITITKNYIYSINLNSEFHLFIDQDSVGFKFPRKNISDKKIDKFSRGFKNIFGDKIEYSPYNTTETNLYSYWSIKVNDNLISEYEQIISKGEKIKNYA